MTASWTSQQNKKIAALKATIAHMANQKRAMVGVISSFKAKMAAMARAEEAKRQEIIKQYKHQKSRALQGIMALRMKEAAKRQKMHAKMAAYKKKEAKMAVVKIKHVTKLYEKLEVHLKNKIARAKKAGRDEEAALLTQFHNKMHKLKLELTRKMAAWKVSVNAKEKAAEEVYKHRLAADKHRFALLEARQKSLKALEAKMLLWKAQYKKKTKLHKYDRMTAREIKAKAARERKLRRRMARTKDARLKALRDAERLAAAKKNAKLRAQHIANVALRAAAATKAHAHHEESKLRHKKAVTKERALALTLSMVLKRHAKTLAERKKRMAMKGFVDTEEKRLKRAAVDKRIKMEESEARYKHKMAAKEVVDAKKNMDEAAMQAKIAEKLHMEAKMKLAMHLKHVKHAKEVRAMRYREEDRIRALERAAKEKAEHEAKMAALSAAGLAKHKEKKKMYKKIDKVRAQEDRELAAQQDKFNKMTAEEKAKWHARQQVAANLLSDAEAHRKMLRHLARAERRKSRFVRTKAEQDRLAAKEARLRRLARKAL